MPDTALFARGRVRARHDVLAHSPRGESRHFQIGPRIRIGGTVGKIGQKVKEDVGKVAKVAAPVAAFIPGAGPLIAAGLNTAGHALDTTDGGLHMNSLPGLALQDAGLYGAGKVGGLVRGAIASKMGTGGAGAGAGGAGTDAHTGLLDWAKRLVIGGGADGKGSMGTLGDLAGQILGGGAGAGGSGGTNDLLSKLLLGGSVAVGAMDEARKRGLENDAINSAKDAYNANAPLRDAARGMLMNRAAPDLSSIFADSGNPYSRQATPPAAGGAPGAPGAPGSSGFPMGAAVPVSRAARMLPKTA